MRRVPVQKIEINLYYLFLLTYVDPSSRIGYALDIRLIPIR